MIKKSYTKVRNIEVISKYKTRIFLHSLSIFSDNVINTIVVMIIMIFSSDGLHKQMHIMLRRNKVNIINVKIVKDSPLIPAAHSWGHARLDASDLYEKARI